MKFATICALVGTAAAAESTVTKAETHPTIPPQVKKMTNDLPCGELHMRMRVNYMVERNMQKQCMTDKTAACEKELENAQQMQEYVEEVYHRRCEGPDIHVTPGDFGAKIEKPDSKNGKISVTYNWRAAEQYSSKWEDWFKHESRDPVVHEVAKHLNAAAHRMVDDLAGGQITVVKNLGKLTKTFVNWVEPGAQCDSSAFVSCLQGEHIRFDGDMFHDMFRHECAKSTGCSMPERHDHFQKRQLKHEGKHDIHHIKRALKNMEHEMKHDFKDNMRDQKDNAMTTYKAFLEEARERYTAWGCEPKCTDDATRFPGNLMHMAKCHCPADITVHGDTSEIFH